MIVALRFPGVAVPIVGAVGATLGRTVRLLEAAPAPTELTALISTVYSVPLVKPLMSAVVPVTAGLKAVKEDPPLVEYW